MNVFSASSALLGGLGLFLVGMWLMTDGLKLAAGESLRDLLQTWTNSRYRGLITGFSITALVQSSSAVTVATIGFANAGLMSLSQAVWVIFGSNVGTTMTGWLVALVGFKVNIDAYALPLIGIGMLIRITGAKSKRAAIGQAILGFGLFFLGISVLKEAFETVGTGIQLPGVQDTGFASMFLYLLLGFILTTLMQSSSAAIVITLSAAEGGLIPLSAAAATVIGANLGTTTTAIISVWGATPLAKRVAVSHVLFNLITALVAIVIIVPMLSLTGWIQGLLSLPPAPATTLSIFHTVFNVLGVLLMWPMADRLVNYLAGKFVSEEETEDRPVYLDDTAIEVPALASMAILREINNLNGKTVSLAMDAINTEIPGETYTISNKNIENLGSAIGDYVAVLSRKDLPEILADRLPEVIFIIQQYVSISELAVDIISLKKKIDISRQVLILDALTGLLQDAAKIFQLADIKNPEFDNDILKQRYEELESSYDALRLQVLRAGAAGDIGMVTVDNQLDQLHIIKRMAKLIIRSATRHEQLITDLGMERSSLNVTA